MVHGIGFTFSVRTRMYHYLGLFLPQNRPPFGTYGSNNGQEVQLRLDPSSEGVNTPRTSGILNTAIKI